MKNNAAVVGPRPVVGLLQPPVAGSVSYVFIVYSTGFAESSGDFITEAEEDSFLDLTRDYYFMQDPVLDIVDTVEHSTASPLHHSQIPTRFLITFTYKPDINTVLRLFSVDMTQPPSHTVTGSTFILSSSLTLVFPLAFYVPVTNISYQESHFMLFYVNNGEISSCVDGHYQSPVSGTDLWSRNARSSSLQLRFSEHLTAIVDRVRHIIILLHFFVLA